jgi:hypothetical protein
MDPSILQLFSPEEIFERIGDQSLTGLLHIYNLRDTSNVFFKNGLIVAAAKGLTEGEDAVRQSLDIRDARYAWHPNVTAPMPPYKPVQIAMSAPPPFLTPGRGSAGMTTALPRLEAPITVQASKPQWPTHATPSPVPSGKVAVLGTLQQELPSLKKPSYSFVAIDNPRQRIHLTKESTLVGRNPACDVALDHGSISRQHCLMQISDRGLHIKDLGTTNGTKVNGVNITESYINPGDQLTMGHLVFLLEKD